LDSVAGVEVSIILDSWSNSSSSITSTFVNASACSAEYASSPSHR
jgi:methylaspartate ammonia-lyase